MSLWVCVSLRMCVPLSVCVLCMCVVLCVTYSVCVFCTQCVYMCHSQYVSLRVCLSVFVSLSSGFVDGVDSLLKFSPGGGFKDDGGDACESSLDVEHGSGDHFEITIGRGEGKGGFSMSELLFEDTGVDLLFEIGIGLLTSVGDIFAKDGVKALHFFIFPEDFSLFSDETDSLTDGIEDGDGLVGDGGAFEGEEIGGLREDGVKAASG